jgi:hypothetical protein
MAPPAPARTAWSPAWAGATATKFVSTTNPVTLGSEWTWNQPNTIPYVKLWTTAVDATMGTVQTQTIVQQDAGGYFGTNRWNSTSAAGLACTVFGNNYRMPCDFNWPYQSINYSLGGGGATNNTRLAWGSNFGWLGQQSYFTHGSAFWGGPLPNTTASGWPRKSYSTFIVLDRHSEDPVGGAGGRGRDRADHHRHRERRQRAHQRPGRRQPPGLDDLPTRRLEPRARRLGLRCRRQPARRQLSPSAPAPCAGRC